MTTTETIEQYRFPHHGQNSEDDYGTVELCEDCIMSDAGYETEVDGDRSFDICPEWHGWGFNFTYSEDDPEGYGEPLHGFSWGTCEGCHSTLGGDRHTMTPVFLFST